MAAIAKKLPYCTKKYTKLFCFIWNQILYKKRDWEKVSEIEREIFPRKIADVNIFWTGILKKSHEHLKIII